MDNIRGIWGLLIFLPTIIILLIIPYLTYSSQNYILINI